MPAVDLVVETEVSSSTRARQVSAMFDVPPQQKCQLRWSFDVPFDVEPWNVGLIVGPSGSGKSSVGRHLFGVAPPLKWAGKSVVDDFERSLPVKDITDACSAVGFNTIPAWLRPYSVLSNGEQFRVEVARRLLEGGDPIVIDEFTSVVDRQVAQIGSHAVQKFVRRNGRKFVAISCHYDILDWLQPDWVLDMATTSFTRRLLQRRPSIECEIKRVPYSTWATFAPFHYMSADLHKAARCFGLFVGGRVAAFASALHRPHPKVADIMGVPRLVTLPDWQGLGLAMALIERVGAAYKAVGKRLRTYPAHPALVRSFDRAPLWSIKQKPGGSHQNVGTDGSTGRFGGRSNAVFEYVGPAMARADAALLLG